MICRFENDKRDETSFEKNGTLAPQLKSSKAQVFGGFWCRRGLPLGCQLVNNLEAKEI